jgi:hypothetical protein
LKQAFNHFVARLYKKQIANFLHIGKTGGNAFTSAVGNFLTTENTYTHVVDSVSEYSSYS